MLQWWNCWIETVGFMLDSSFFYPCQLLRVCGLFFDMGFHSVRRWRANRRPERFPCVSSVQIRMPSDLRAPQTSAIATPLRASFLALACLWMPLAYFLCSSWFEMVYDTAGCTSKAHGTSLHRLFLPDSWSVFHFSIFFSILPVRFWSIPTTSTRRSFPSSSLVDRSLTAVVSQPTPHLTGSISPCGITSWRPMPNWSPLKAGRLDDRFRREPNGWMVDVMENPKQKTDDDWGDPYDSGNHQCGCDIWPWNGHDNHDMGICGMDQWINFPTSHEKMSSTSNPSWSDQFLQWKLGLKFGGLITCL